MFLSEEYFLPMLSSSLTQDLLTGLALLRIFTPKKMKTEAELKRGLLCNCPKAMEQFSNGRTAICPPSFTEGNASLFICKGYSEDDRLLSLERTQGVSKETCGYDSTMPRTVIRADLLDGVTLPGKTQSCSLDMFLALSLSPNNQISAVARRVSA